VLTVAQLVVSEVVVAGVAAVIDSDMAVAQGRSGREKRGWGVCWGAIGRLGSVCRRFRDAGGSFEAGEKVVVAVVDSVDSVDGGCAAVVSGDDRDGPRRGVSFV
jgi:hypothetical protein